MAMLKLVTKYVYSALTRGLTLKCQLASLFFSYCWWCQKTPAENFQCWRRQILKPFCNKYNINYHQLFYVVQDIFPLSYGVMVKKYASVI